MKKIILIAALAVASLAATAQPSYQSITVGAVPTTLTGATNFASNILIDCRNQKDITFQASSGAAGLQTNTFTFCVSVDGVNVDTNSARTFLCVTPAGAPRISTTNYTVNGAGWLVLTRLAGTDTTIANTNSLKYGYKPAVQ